MITQLNISLASDRMLLSAAEKIVSGVEAQRKEYPMLYGKPCAVHRRFRKTADRVTASAVLYAAFKAQATLGEPIGVTA